MISGDERACVREARGCVRVVIGCVRLRECENVREREFLYVMSVREDQ